MTVLRRNVGIRSLRSLALVFGLFCCCVGTSRAMSLPSPAELRRQLGEPQHLKVIEPHLSSREREVQIDYRGYPVPQLLAHLLGDGWSSNAREREVEFRGLDGFVTRVSIGRLISHRAFLVFAREDGGEFIADNPLQAEKRVPLGPYYLIWDNIGIPALIAEGAALWPYQVAEVSLRMTRKAALLPEGMPLAYADTARQAQKFCLSCHQINGFGGDKVPLNLAARARQIDAARWRQLVLAPQQFRPGINMPPLPETLKPAEREALAAQLHRYLSELPVAGP